METFEEFLSRKAREQGLKSSGFTQSGPAPQGFAEGGRETFDEFLARKAQRGITKPGPDEEAPFLERAGTMAKAIGKGLYSAAFDVLPKTLAETYRAGDIKLEDENSWISQFIQEQKDDLVRRQLSPQEAAQTIFGVSAGTVKAGLENLGYGGATALGGMGLGAAAAAPIPVPGARILGGVLGAGTMGAAVGYRATKDQFVADILERAKRQDPFLTPEKWNEIREAIEDDAQLYGFWEAAPETVGNMLMAGIIKLPLGTIFKNIPFIKSKIGNALAKASTALGEELITETKTAVEQSKIEARQGLRDKELTYEEAFKEVAPQTAVTTLATLGLGSRIERLGKRPVAPDIPQERVVADDPTSKPRTPVIESIVDGIAAAEEVKQAQSILDLTPEMKVPRPAPPVELTPEMRVVPQKTEAELLAEDLRRQEKEAESPKARIERMFPLAGKKEGGADMVQALAQKELEQRAAREAGHKAEVAIARAPEKKQKAEMSPEEFDSLLRERINKLKEIDKITNEVTKKTLPQEQEEKFKLLEQVKEKQRELQDTQTVIDAAIKANPALAEKQKQQAQEPIKPVQEPVQEQQPAPKETIKPLSEQGLKKMKVADLREYATSIGINPKVGKRWIKKFDLVKQIVAKQTGQEVKLKQKEKKVEAKAPSKPSVSEKVTPKKESVPVAPESKYPSEQLLGITVKVKAVREATGETIIIKKNAKEALADVDEQYTMYEKLLQCLTS